MVWLQHNNMPAKTLGEFELSMGVPLTGYNMVTQVKLLSETLSKLASLVLRHVVPNTKRTRKYAESSPSLITVPPQ